MTNYEPPRRPIRYGKKDEFVLDGKKYVLIDFLKERRTENKITKKFISNIIKGNDYWYSQIEMGRDDNRRKYIERDELANIISIIIFNAKNFLEVKHYKLQSLNYIDNVLKLKYNIPGELPVYEIENKFLKRQSDEYANKLLDDTLKLFNGTISSFYKVCSPLQRQAILDYIGYIAINFHNEPLLTMHYCSFPFYLINLVEPINKENEDVVIQELLKDLDNFFIKYVSLLKTDNILDIEKTIINHHVMFKEVLRLLQKKSESDNTDDDES